MALQSSGQIKLSEIRNEFGLGSGQIAMSSLYGKGNAAASGQIQMAANFYGTSSEVVLHSSTITPGTVTQKSGAVTFRGYDRSGSISGSNIGNISTTAISGTSRIVTMVMDRDDTATPPIRYFEVRFNGIFTGWTSIRVNGSKVATRTSATLVASNTGYRWSAANNNSFPVPTSFEIIQ